MTLLKLKRNKRTYVNRKAKGPSDCVLRKVMKNIGHNGRRMEPLGLVHIGKSV